MDQLVHGIPTLSVKQPWASLIFCGKDVENRVWMPKYRGKLLIHASGTYDRNLPPYLFYDEIFDTLPDNMQDAICDRKAKNDLPYGAIIGMVNLRSVTMKSSSPWAEAGCYHWEPTDQKELIEPIRNVKGQLRIWYYRTNELSLNFKEGGNAGQVEKSQE